jgi:hypothetical protein
LIAPLMAFCAFANADAIAPMDSECVTAASVVPWPSPKDSIVRLTLAALARVSEDHHGLPVDGARHVFPAGALLNPKRTQL